MKLKRIVTVCLLPVLLALAWIAFTGCRSARRAQVAPPPPKVPAVMAITLAERERATELAATLPPPAPRIIYLPKWRLPTTNFYVYRIYNTTGKYIGEGGGDVELPNTNQMQFFRLRAELTLDDWLKGLCR